MNRSRLTPLFSTISGVALLALFAGLTCLPAAARAGTTVFNLDDLTFEGKGGPAELTYFNGDPSFGSLDVDAVNGDTSGAIIFFAAPNTQGLEITHNAPPNGGSTTGRLNEYTLIMDVKFNQLGTPQNYAALYQTDPTDTSDGDWFVRNSPSGIGISGEYQGEVLSGQFYRLGLVVDLSNDPAVPKYFKYIDGQLVGAQGAAGGPGIDGDGAIDGRFSLGPSFLLLTDEDGETSEGSLSAVLFADRAFSPEEMAALGGSSAEGFPVVPEPSSICLLALGGAGLFCRAVRRRK